MAIFLAEPIGLKLTEPGSAMGYNFLPYDLSLSYLLSPLVERRRRVRLSNGSSETSTFSRGWLRSSILSSDDAGKGLRRLLSRDSQLSEAHSNSSIALSPSTLSSQVNIRLPQHQRFALSPQSGLGMPTQGDARLALYWEGGLAGFWRVTWNNRSI
jgi:hypothetical protein